MPVRKKRRERVAETANAQAEEPTRKRPSDRLVARYGGHAELLTDGFVPVARTYVKYAAQLKPHGLVPAESLFIINLLYHKWDAQRPYPSYKSIAARMGVSVQYARDLARRLERKGFIRREVRVGRPNLFDIQPLLDKLAAHVAAEAAKKTA